MKIVLIFLILLFFESTNATRRKEIFRTFNLISADYNVVCLYANEAFKTNDFKDSIKSVVNEHCNVHIYSYALLIYDEYGSFSYMNANNVKREMQMMQLFTESIRQKSVKESRVLVSIGRPYLKLNDFLRIVKHVNYTQFANDAIDFYTSNDFDGLNFQFTINEGDSKTTETAEILKTFIMNIKSELFKITMAYKLPLLQLSFTLHFDSSAAFKDIDVFSEFFKIFDIINFVPFKIDNPTQPKEMKQKNTKFYLPLFSPDQQEMTLSFLVDEALKLNIARYKIIFAVPFFGKSYKLKDYARSRLGDPINGLGKPGKSSQRSGFLSYGEICYNLEKYGTRIRTWNESYMAPYLHFSDQWVTYEDEDSLKQKIRYLKCNGIRGTMLYAVDFDDYSNQCKKNSTQPPLTTLVNREILNDDWSVCQSDALISKKANYTNRLGDSKSGQYKMAKYPVTTTEAPPVLPPLVGTDVCLLAENNNRFSADPTNCRVFYHCYNQKALKRTCPFSLAFNNKINVCDFKANVINC